MSENKYIARTVKPEKGNKYYTRKANGGYSDAIQGSPTDKDCNVLSNCVGYAYGRFNEIGGWGECRYLAPVNAKDFIKYKGDCRVGQIPQLGACMVWENSGAGHVAIVEKIISEGEVVTSESVWGGSAFYTANRKKGTDGNWGYGGSFLGFIYNPAVFENKENEMYIVYKDIKGYNSAADAKAGKNSVTTVKKGEYYLFNKYPNGYDGMYNLTSNPNSAGSWINPTENKPENEPQKAVDREVNIARLITAAFSDGIKIGWNEAPMAMSSKCLVQQWKDKTNRYPNLTRLAQGLLNIKETGICDDFMTLKIKEYQKSKGLTADGGIGKSTWEYLLGLK